MARAINRTKIDRDHGPRLLAIAHSLAKTASNIATYRSRWRLREMTHSFGCTRLVGVMLILVSAASLAGCGVVAFPVRVTSAAAKIVPVAGDVVAYPLDKTADVID
jgi:hypothetical protein